MSSINKSQFSTFINGFEAPSHEDKEDYSFLNETMPFQEENPRQNAAWNDEPMVESETQKDANDDKQVQDVDSNFANSQPLPDNTSDFWSKVNFDHLKSLVQSNPDAIFALPQLGRSEYSSEKYTELWHIAKEAKKSLLPVFPGSPPTQLWSHDFKKLEADNQTDDADGQPMLSDTETVASLNDNEGAIRQEFGMLAKEKNENNNFGDRFDKPFQFGPFPQIGCFNYSPMKQEKLVEEPRRDTSIQQGLLGEQERLQFNPPTINMEQDGTRMNGPMMQIPHSFQPGMYQQKQEYPNNISSIPMINNQMQSQYQVPYGGAPGFHQVQAGHHVYERRRPNHQYYNGSESSGYATNESNSEKDLESLFHETMSISSSSKSYRLSTPVTVPRTSPIYFKSPSRPSSPPTSEFRGYSRSSREDRAPENPHSPPARIRTYNPSQKQFEYECVFCKGNNQSESVYKSHPIRISDTVLCPFLRKHICGLCGATGDNAHTIKYCPYNIRGFFAGRNTNYPQRLHWEEYEYGTEIANISSRTQVRQLPPPIVNFSEYPRIKKEPVVRKLNFDAENTYKTNSMFLKNLQQLHGSGPKLESVGRYH